MSAYAVPTPAVTSSAPERPNDSEPRRLARDSSLLPETAAADRALAGLLDLLANRIADLVVARLGSDSEPGTDEWLDSRDAAAYLGVHRDTLRRLAAERTIRSEQEGPGCKLFFQRDDLDAWRRGGGRGAHLTAVARV